MKARVFVTYKEAVLDPQGEAVRKAIRSMGYQGFNRVRQGKIFEIELEGLSPQEAEKAVNDVADKLLHNVNIEQYRVEIE
jgi:phosphoribosylformylglycinamidine synthase